MRRLRRSRKGKLSPGNAAHMIGEVLKALRGCRSNLRLAGAPKAADYVARAIKSAEGAHRHAQRRRTTEAAG